MDIMDIVGEYPRKNSDTLEKYPRKCTDILGGYSWNDMDILGGDVNLLLIVDERLHIVMNPR